MELVPLNLLLALDKFTLGSPVYNGLQKKIEVPAALKDGDGGISLDISIPDTNRDRFIVEMLTIESKYFKIYFIVRDEPVSFTQLISNIHYLRSEIHAVDEAFETSFMQSIDTMKHIITRERYEGIRLFQIFIIHNTN
jgi:hypothetical protein